MVLIDTSVWIQHFRKVEPALVERLSEGNVLIHPFVSGELACGNLRNRATILNDLNALPPAQVASDSEVIRLVEKRRLWGQGLGWVDVHLLASALLSHCALWTFDRKLAANP